MTLEIGGRADKVGNEYENHFLGKQLLRLAEGELLSVEVEPLGDEGSGVEYISTKHDNARIYYQCKSSNGSKNQWSIADLDGHKVFTNAKNHILSSDKNEYHFISPLAYDGLDDLCARARTNHSAKDFVEHQLTNQNLRKQFKKCGEKLGLSDENDRECQKLVSILSQCYFDQVPNTQESLQDIEARVAWNFSGNARAARLVLENFVNDEGRYGVQISTHDVILAMQSRGFNPKKYGQDESVWQRIENLNSIYWGAYLPINGTLLPRNAAMKVIEYLENGDSVLLHGKAGSGKSGCVELISKYLEENGTLYLRLKLDKNIPQNSSTEYGRALGLPDSPVRCLQSVSGNKKCVLILDQLDALRWTTIHSPTAMAVCKELLHEVRIANEYYGANISVLCITRSFDCKSDAGIRNLFAVDNGKTETWKKVELGTLSDKEVVGVVGNCYSSFSQKLKELLHSPASLYVWTCLDDNRRAQPITSANELFAEWWIQILEHCAQKGFARSDVDALIKSLAQRMCSSSLFALPRRGYAAQSRILDALISEGMIVDNSAKISFTHQSFLDYFVVCDYVDQVSAGKSLLNVIGPPDEQIPNLRYRFLVLLQELCMWDEDLFLKECTNVLTSENVRYYYKCTVFEAMAQQSCPSDAMCRFVEDYWNDPSWHEYVRQVVYYGNPAYIAHLADNTEIAWLSDEGLWLLRSINEKAPEFVVDMLRPLCFQNSEDDSKILSCMCFDIESDSEEMYQLQKSILKVHPNLISNSWTNYYGAFKSGTTRIIDYLMLILENHLIDTVETTHLPDEKELSEYAKEKYQEVMEHIIPKLCEITAGMTNDIEKIWFSDECKKWIEQEYNESVFRKIVYIAKTAVQEMAEKEPEKVADTLFIDEYAESFVGNELILTAIECLPLSYADTAFEWILSNFSKHIFVYTGETSDYLSMIKRIIKKFSSVCSAELFLRLEQCIIKWKEPTSQMVSILRRRIEISKTSGYYPVYYAYWGFMQKEMLPQLDQTRISVAAKELLAVLNRNTWVRIPNYRSPFSGGMAKNVISPIAGYTDRISDKTWLRIIKTPTAKMSRHGWRETESAFIEATPMEFAASLGAQAQRQPDRFARLSLRFPDGCYQGYISGVLRALKREDALEQCAGVDLTCAVIRKYACLGDRNIQIAIAEIVRTRASECWPDDIYTIIEQFALQPIQEPKSTHTGEEKSKESAQSLYNGVYNSPQGTAIQAITSLLFEHRDLHERFKETVIQLVASEEPVIQLAVIDCIVAYYNTDVPFSVEQFRSLIQRNNCLLIANNAWEIMSRDYNDARELYVECLLSAISSGIEDLEECATGHLCAVAIYKEDQQLQQQILKSIFSDKQAERICLQAKTCFTYDKYREVSKKFILHAVRDHDLGSYAIGSEFLKKNIVVERDKDFLLGLVNQNSKSRCTYAMLEFLCETDENIADFAEIIYAVAKQAAERQDDYPMRISIEKLVQCTAHLYDIGKDDPKIKTICLNIWDELFKNNLHDIKSLATMLDNLS